MTSQHPSALPACQSRATFFGQVRREGSTSISIQRSAGKWQHLPLAPDLMDAASSRGIASMALDPGLKSIPNLIWSDGAGSSDGLVILTCRTHPSA